MSYFLLSYLPLTLTCLCCDILSQVYFKEARELLGSEAWEKDYDSMLQLCSKEAQARFITGDIEIMEVLIEEVLSKDIPIKDKFEAFEVKILAAQGANRFDEAISTSLEVRKKLGLRAPANKPASKFTVLKEYIKTNRIVNGRTAKEIAELPDLKDERVIMGQRMLEMVSCDVSTSFYEKMSIFA